MTARTHCTMHSPMTAFFLRDLSQPTREHLNSLPFKIWDRFHTDKRNLDVTHHNDIDKPTRLVFREFDSRYELTFTVNDAGVVTMHKFNNNMWAPFADKLHSLLSLHDVQFSTSLPSTEDACDEKIAKLINMEYADLYKLYRASYTFHRRGMKKDRASLVRRLSKIL